MKRPHGGKVLGGMLMAGSVEPTSNCDEHTASKTAPGAYPHVHPLPDVLLPSSYPGPLFCSLIMSTACSCTRSYKKLAVDVKPGSQILCADGSIVLEVISTDPAAGTVRARCLNTAMLGSVSGVEAGVNWALLSSWVGQCAQHRRAQQHSRR
jgi:hypothetical protein